jgi:hypothetical protein
MVARRKAGGLLRDVDRGGARRPNLVANVKSQIVSTDIETGDLVEHTSGLKLYHQFISATESAEFPNAAVSR